MNINWTLKKYIVFFVTLCSSVGIGIFNTIERATNPNIPINKMTNTIGILLFLFCFILPFVLHWNKKS